VLLYAAGSAADYLWTDLSTTGAFTRTQQQVTVNGSYIPVTGDFDRDGCSDILWYAPGSAPDTVWWGAPTGFTPGPRVSVAGTYVPVPGYYGGAADGVFWYDPDGTERLWLGTGNRSAPFRSVATRQVAGSTYRPVTFGNAGSAAGELLFHAPGSAADAVWRFHQTVNGFVVDQSTRVTLNGSYLPGGCHTKVVLHAPTGADKLFTTTPVDYITHDLTIVGSYRVGSSGNQTRQCTVVLHRPGSASDQLWISST
jgi:hypothetical protein